MSYTNNANNVNIIYEQDLDSIMKILKLDEEAVKEILLDDLTDNQQTLVDEWLNEYNLDCEIEYAENQLSY